MSTKYPFPGFPEKVVGFLINGSVTMEYLYDHIDGVSQRDIAAGITRLIERGHIRMDDAGEICLPRGDRLMADIAASPTTEELYGQPQSCHGVERFDTAAH